MAAVFAVSDSITSDSIREQLRGESLGLFLGVRDAIASRGSVSAQDGSRLSLRALSVAAMLEVACRLGEVTEGNYALLRAELVKLADTMVQPEDGAEAELDPRILEDGLADRPQPKPARPAARTREASLARPAPRAELPASAAADLPEAATHEPAPFGVSFSGSVMDMMKSLSDSIKDRESHVLDIVRKKGKVSIKDVMAEMPAVGEKTVQRALINLVAKGNLKKTGDRRWSRYEVSQANLGV